MHIKRFSELLTNPINTIEKYQPLTIRSYTQARTQEGLQGMHPPNQT